MLTSVAFEGALISTTTIFFLPFFESESSVLLSSLLEAVGVGVVLLSSLFEEDSRARGGTGKKSPNLVIRRQRKGGTCSAKGESARTGDEPSSELLAPSSSSRLEESEDDGNSRCTLVPKKERVNIAKS